MVAAQQGVADETGETVTAEEIKGYIRYENNQTLGSIDSFN